MNRDRTLMDGHAPAGIALRWLEVDKWPRLIVTARLRLLWSNSAFERVLRAGNGIEQRDGGLWVSESAAQERLQKLVATPQPGIWTLLIKGQDGESPMLLRGRELTEQEEERIFGIQVLGGTNHSAGNGHMDGHYDGIDEAFGLTRAEYRVLRSLIDGRTADEIAIAHQVAVDTVRSQIRGIYEKMNVSSREGLFSRIRPFGY